MAEKIISIPNVGDIAFPESVSEVEISAAAQKLYAQANQKQPVTTQGMGQPQGASVAGTLARKGAPIARRVAEELATNPGVPKAFAKAGRMIGAVAPAIGGGAKYGPVGALAGMGQAATGAWAGGKTGWFTGKLAQNIAAPVAKALAAAEPIVEKVATSPLLAAQGGLDLAQMAEPNRSDIGILGMGRSVDTPDVTPAQQDAMYVKAVGQLIEDGATLPKAAAIIAQGDHGKLVRVINAYIKAQRVKP